MTEPAVGATRNAHVPDVTVVIIGFNDVARLPRAIRSVQRQTLRNLEIVVVDDASTDGTADAVRALAATDARIRYECLPQNSGGCSAPRNRGIELARAPWLMFCDSDDEYERHACKNLLEAVERTGADVACGAAERVDIRTGRVRTWRPEVHDVERVADGIADLPDLLYDTVSVNKIYRADLIRGQGIRFPEGLLFEDQLFTLEVMASATRIAAIPQVVYRWYVDRLSDEPSITQRRNEARNVESRIEVNRRIDAFLDERGLDGVRRFKDLKFLRHDLYLYLSSMLEVDDDTARLLMERLRPYVSQCDLLRAWELRPALRVAVYHLLVGDLEGVRSAMRFVKWASVVDVPVRAEDGRTLWGCEHLDAGPQAGGIPAREWLDVTALGLLDIPFTQRRYLHRIDSLAAEGDRVVAVGSAVDYDGLLDDSTAIELRLLVGGDRILMSVPAAWTERDGGRRRWRADGVPWPVLGRAMADKDRGTLAVALTRGSHVNVTGARAPEAAAPWPVLPYPGPARTTGPDAVALIPQENGAIGWRPAQVSPSRMRRASALATWFRLPGTRWLARLVAAVRRDVLPPVAARVGGLLPARPLAVVVGGRRAVDDNVRAVAAHLAERCPEIGQVWTYRAAPSRPPVGATVVEQGTVREAWLQARARLRVDDGVAAATLPLPDRLVVVCARSEVPVHRVGLDDPDVLVSRSQVASVRARARQWDVLCAPSEASGARTAAAFGFGGRVAVAGLPRMDAALRHLAGVDGRSALRQHLDLPPERDVVLHLPADRAEGGDVLDVEAWCEQLGGGCYLVLRHRPGLVVPTRLRAFVRVLAADDDLGLHIGASDLVVSDYSPLIGDAVLVDRPVVLFQPDRETYVNRTHGLYPGADRIGPVVTDVDALVAEVRDWRRDRIAWDVVHGPVRRAWAAQWCGPADGRAAERVVDSLVDSLVEAVAR